MGQASSYDESRQCLNIDERLSYIILRLYSNLLQIKEKLESVIIGKVLGSAIKDNSVSFLVNTDTLNELLNELVSKIPDLEKNQSFSEKIEQVVGVSDGYAVYKTVTFFDSYNALILKIAKEKDKDFFNEVELVKQMFEQKIEILNRYFNTICTTDIGVL
jgi:hypothetical protein